MYRPCTLQICLLDMVDESKMMKDIIQVMLWPLSVNFKLGYSYIVETKDKTLKYCFTSKSLCLENHTFHDKADALKWIESYRTPHQDDIQRAHDDQIFSTSGLRFIKRVACTVWIEK